jgi:hypothetical protein
LTFDKGSGKHHMHTEWQGATTSASGYAKSVKANAHRIRSLETSPEQERAIAAENERRVQELKKQVESSESKIVREKDATLRKRGSEIAELYDGWMNASESQNDSTRRAEELGRSLRAAQEETERERTKLEQLRRRFSRTEKMLEMRTNELNAAKAFLTTADEYSVADVVHMVTQLNDDIYQCAAFMADETIKRDGSEEESGNAPSARMTQALQELVDSGCGREWVERLRTDILEQDTIVFEAMAQNVFVHWCLQVVSSFCPDSAMDEYLQGVWTGIAKTGKLNLINLRRRSGTYHKHTIQRR